MPSGPHILQLGWTKTQLRVFLRQAPQTSSIFVQDLIRALTDWSPAAANSFVAEHRAQMASEGHTFLEIHNLNPAPTTVSASTEKLSGLCKVMLKKFGPGPQAQTKLRKVRCEKLVQDVIAEVNVALANPNALHNKQTPVITTAAESSPLRGAVEVAGGNDATALHATKRPREGESVTQDLGSQKKQKGANSENHTSRRVQSEPVAAYGDSDPIPEEAGKQQPPSQQTDALDLSAHSDEEQLAGSVAQHNDAHDASASTSEAASIELPHLLRRNSQTSEDVMAELLVGDKSVDAPQIRAELEGLDQRRAHPDGQTDNDDDEEEEVDLTGDTADHTDIAPPIVRIVGKRKVGDGTEAFEYSVLPQGQWLHQDAAELDQNARREWDRRQEQGCLQHGVDMPVVSDEGDNKPVAKHHIVLGQDPPASLVRNDTAGIGLGLSVEALMKADVLRRKGAS